MLDVQEGGTTPLKEVSARIKDKLGTVESYNHYSVGWAWAMCTPYQWTKQVASHWGGTRNGTIIHWPEGVTAHGEVRDQFHHVIDVAPTVLAAAHMVADNSKRTKCTAEVFSSVSRSKSSSAMA